MIESGTLLTVRGLNAGYGDVNVLNGIDLHVDPGEIVVVLGPNGAGKTTLMRAVAGVIPHTGEIALRGEPVLRARPDQILNRGVSLIPQGRGTFSELTVVDNLRVGAISRRDQAEVMTDMDRWFSVFPRLAERRGQIAGTLSGGEQQMLAIARAMMSRPSLLMCDEVSLGLAPRIVQELFETLREVNEELETGLLLVEQNAELAMDIASRVYILDVGSVASSGPVDQFKESDDIRRAYLGY